MKLRHGPHPMAMTDMCVLEHVWTRRYMDPAQQAAAANVRSALGVEYAGGWGVEDEVRPCPARGWLSLWHGLVPPMHLKLCKCWPMTLLYTIHQDLPPPHCMPTVLFSGPYTAPLTSPRILSPTQGCLPSPCASSACNAFLSTFAAKLRAEAQSYEGNKMAKRKHQIGTLFYNAKMKELEILEGKASSMRHKSETQAKYGW